MIQVDKKKMVEICLQDCNDINKIPEPMFHDIDTPTDPTARLELLYKVAREYIIREYGTRRAEETIRTADEMEADKYKLEKGHYLIKPSAEELLPATALYVYELIITESPTVSVSSSWLPDWLASSSTSTNNTTITTTHVKKKMKRIVLFDLSPRVVLNLANIQKSKSVQDKETKDTKSFLPGSSSSSLYLSQPFALEMPSKLREFYHGMTQEKLAIWKSALRRGGVGVVGRAETKNMSRTVTLPKPSPLPSP